MTDGSKKIKKSSSPFKDVAELEKDIKSFSNKFKLTIEKHSGRLATFFEMDCFNAIILNYQKRGYKVTSCNLINKKFKYKTSPSGLQKNFSYFTLEKDLEGVLYTFDVHHNLAIESAHSSNIYTTPDIVVVMKNSIQNDPNFYKGKRTYDYVPSLDLITFFEIKHFTPFPELVFNFIGVVNELKPNALLKRNDQLFPCHPAPTLVVSGYPNNHLGAIKESLEIRYNLNIFYDMFNSRNNFIRNSLLNFLQNDDTEFSPVEPQYTLF